MGVKISVNVIDINFKTFDFFDIYLDDMLTIQINLVEVTLYVKITFMHDLILKSLIYIYMFV